METKRQRQTAEMLRRHMGSVFLQEGSYIYGDAMVTVTKIKVTPDMGEAKIYLSIFRGGDKDTILKQIRDNISILKRALSARVKNHLRRMPRIQFFLDESLDEVARMDKLFADLRSKNLMGEEE